MTTKKEKEQEQLAIFNDNHPLKLEAVQKTVRQSYEETKEFERLGREIQAVFDDFDNKVSVIQQLARLYDSLYVIVRSLRPKQQQETSYNYGWMNIDH